MYTPRRTLRSRSARQPPSPTSSSRSGLHSHQVIRAKGSTIGKHCSNPGSASKLNFPEYLRHMPLQKMMSRLRCCQSFFSSFRHIQATGMRHTLPYHCVQSVANGGLLLETHLSCGPLSVSVNLRSPELSSLLLLEFWINNSGSHSLSVIIDTPGYISPWRLDSLLPTVFKTLRRWKDASLTLDQKCCAQLLATLHGIGRLFVLKRLHLEVTPGDSDEISIFRQSFVLTPSLHELIITGNCRNSLSKVVLNNLTRLEIHSEVPLNVGAMVVSGCINLVECHLCRIVQPTGPLMDSVSILGNLTKLEIRSGNIEVVHFFKVLTCPSLTKLDVSPLDLGLHESLFLFCKFLERSGCNLIELFILDGARTCVDSLHKFLKLPGLQSLRKLRVVAYCIGWASMNVLNRHTNNDFLPFLEDLSLIGCSCYNGTCSEMLQSRLDVSRGRSTLRRINFSLHRFVSYRADMGSITYDEGYRLAGLEYGQNEIVATKDPQRLYRQDISAFEDMKRRRVNLTYSFTERPFARLVECFHERNQSCITALRDAIEEWM